MCGSAELHYVDELSPALIGEWGLSRRGGAYVNRQQGLPRVRCGSTLRCMALATAMLRHLRRHRHIRGILGIADAAACACWRSTKPAACAPFLAKWPGHRLVRYPEVDMQHLPHADGAFDLVVHSDTLEHVPDPVRGLAECRRVLRDGGACIFTVPIIVGRLTRSRAGLPPSYHGDPANGDGYLVHTEFGADAWRWPLAAGFAECRVVSLEHPAAHALTAVR